MGRLSPAKHGRATALIALFAFALPIPAQAAGEILITQAKANAGNVTPGDNPDSQLDASKNLAISARI